MQRITNTSSIELPLSKNFITLADGSGGESTCNLINGLIAPRLNILPSSLDDSAVLDIANLKIAFTADSFVVNPPFFPGGDIGKLSVCGTVNDLAVQAAQPIALTLSFIIEEGLALDTFETILDSINSAAAEAKVKIVAGDTKVVGRGSCDKIFINTSGIGVINNPASLQKHKIEPGDGIIVSGPVGMHGIAVMAARFEFELDKDLISDCRPLNAMTSSLCSQIEEDVKWMRDPTRGGLANLLNDLAKDTNCDINIDERSIPATGSAKFVADMLGIDVLESASEGIFACVVSKNSINKAIGIIESAGDTKASLIGHVGDGSIRPRVFLNTAIGGKTIINRPTGEQLPRIC